jgi:hypothetical protein
LGSLRVLEIFPVLIVIDPGGERERERERERCDHNIFGVGFVLFVVGCGDSGRILFAFFWRCITGSL